MERILVGIAVVLLGIAFILLGDVSGDAIMALIGAFVSLIGAFYAISWRYDNKK